MNRFRKKPDARNVPRQNDPLPALGVPSSAPPSQQHFQHHHPQLPLLALPTITSADDFRSSVIIPDLGKRFSILTRNGILAADRIRSKLAQQRAAGDENRITEEEEDFLMHALSSLQISRSNNPTVSSAPPGETSFPASVTSRPSFHSGPSTAELSSGSLYPMFALSPSALTPQEPPFSARSYKRASNNLFGSGQFRDRSYIRAAKSTNGHRSPASPIGASAERTHYGSSELEHFTQIDETSEVEHSPGLVEEDQIRIQVPPVVVEDKAGYSASGSEGSSGSGSSNRRVLPGTELTVAQARRMSRALERALSSISSDDENGDLMDDETILAPPLARSFPKGSNGNQNHSPSLPSQHHLHPQPHPQQIPQQQQPQQPQWQQGLETQTQNQNQAIRTEDIRAMLSYLSQTDIGLRAIRETPELAEIINTTTFTTTTNTYSPPPHQQQPFRESEIELDSDSAASATSSSNSPHPPRNATASPVPDSSQRVPGYVPGMHRPITPQCFGNGVTGGAVGEFDSDDYSTTPRATSPTNMVRLERSERERVGGMPMRPVIGVREGGGVRGIAMEGASSIQGVLSGERDRRRGVDSPPLTLGELMKRRPASPLSQVHIPPSAPSSRPSTGGSTSAQVNANLSHPNSNSNVDVNARIPGATHTPSSSKSESNYSSAHSHNRMDSSSSSNLDQEHEQDQGITEAYAGGSGLARSKSIASRSIASPALPDSPLIDNERNMTGHFHAGSGSQSWDNSSSKSMSPISVGPALLYKNATAGGSRPSTPNIQRPTTPGLGGQRPITPVSAAGTTVARSPTPNYLLQRSPSAAGYHSEHERPGSAMGNTRAQHHAVAHSNSIRTTPSHTSSSSASNPLLQTSFDNSSRSSLESVGSSYHSSDGEMEDKKAKMLMTLLFEPDSERAKLVRKRLGGVTGSSSSLGGPGEGKKANGLSFMNGGGGEGEENGHGQPKGSDSPISALGDQEDTLQLLTGLTKKDVATIQQKLVSAYVTREAENALKASQRRRRPSVQSRDLATSPTPRPAANVAATNNAPSVAPSTDVTTQQPAPPGPPSSTSITSVEPVKATPSPAAPVVVPQSGRETPSKVEDQRSGSIPSPTAAVVDFSTANSAPDSRAPSECDHAHKDASQPTTQGQTPSPRARALAEALFGSGEPSPVSSTAVRPLSASLSNSPDTPATPFIAHVTSEGNLEEDVGRKAAAATAALKNSSEATSLALKRKATKKIQTKQISGPQLLSASMSVDAIPLASPVSVLAPASPLSHQDASSGSNSRASGKGLLGRWRSLRKSQQSGMLEPIETSSSTLVRQDSLSPIGQTIVYQPTTIHTPEIQSVPPPGTTPSSPPQHQWPQSAGPTQTMPIASPPATSGGLKGFMTRLRQSKGSARKEEAKGSPATPSVALQNAAATPSSPLQQRDARRSPPHQSHNQSSMHPLFQRMRGPTSDSASPPTLATPQEEEEAVQAFRRAGKSLGLEDEMINGFLLQRSNSTTRAGSSDVPRQEGANSPLVAPSPSPSSRKLSTRAKQVEASGNPRARVMRDGVDPLSAVVRRTIIVPSTSASAFSSSSNIMTEGRIASPVLRKSSTRRRPPSATSQHSAKSPITDRAPTPPPPRGGRRFSEDTRPPLPSLPGTPLHHLTPMNQSSHAGGYESPTSSRPSMDNSGTDLNDGNNMRGVGIEVVELANGEVVWSVLDSLRGTHAPLDVEDDESSLYFRDRMSVISHYTEPTEELQMTFKQAPRGAAHPSSSKAADVFRPETKVFYSDANDITRLIEQMTNGADSGSFNLVPKPASRAGGGSFSTMHTTRTEDLPVEDQLDRLIQRVSIQDSP